MRRMPSSARRKQTRRTQPLIEGLGGTPVAEQRLASGTRLDRRLRQAACSRTDGTRFTYTTPSGGRP